MPESHSHTTFIGFGGFGEEQFAQIAYRIGYEHPPQFDRDFHLAFGVTPSELRQVLRSRDPIC